MAAPLRQGTIVYATMISPRGESKPRPCIIYTPDNLIPLSETVGVVGITTSYRPGDPKYIPLPWRDDGRIHTRLKRQSAITFDLMAEVDKSRLRPTGGCLLQDEAAFVAMLAELKRLSKL